MVMVFGEITTSAKVDYEAVVRKTCKEIGFTSEDVGLDADTCKVLYFHVGLGCLLCVEHHHNHHKILAQVLVHIEEQSPDIGQGVHGMGTKTLEEVGAGDQVCEGVCVCVETHLVVVRQSLHHNSPHHHRATCLAMPQTRQRSSCP